MALLAKTFAGTVPASISSSVIDPVPGIHIRAGVAASRVRMQRLPEVLGETGKKKSSHYQDIKDGIFTPPVSMGCRCSAWPDYEVQAIIAARIAGKTTDEVRQLVKQLIEIRKMGSREVLS